MEYIRQNIKANAKAALKTRYGACVGVALVVLLISLIVNGSDGLRVWQEAGTGSWNLDNGRPSLLPLLTVFLIPLLSVGVNAFHVRVYRRREAGVGTMFAEGFTGYWRKLGGVLWMGLWIVLWVVPAVLLGIYVGFALGFANPWTSIELLWVWMLLFIIPGIIKSLSYSMAPYILADCPQVGAREALRLSKRMTNGHKAEIFVLQLSFIGWMILGAITFGILLVAFVDPYMSLSKAGQYDYLKNRAVDNGVIQPEEFGPEAA